MFSGNRKRNLATPTDERASVNTPEANNGTVPDNKIHQTEQEVKGEAEKFSRRSYWKPQLKKEEWNLLNKTIDRELHSGENFLDDRTKFAYAKEKGTEVFSIYGIGDGTEATVLYASGGETAFADCSAISRTKESVEDGTFRTARSCYRVFTSLRRKNGRNLSDNFVPERRGTAVGVGGLSGADVGKSAVSGDDYAEGASDSGDVKTSRRITPEMDRAYLTAVEKGDLETAQRMVDEAAEGAMQGSEVRLDIWTFQSTHPVWGATRRAPTYSLIRAAPYNDR